MAGIDQLRHHRRDRGGDQHRHQRRDRKLRQQDLTGKQCARNRAVEHRGNTRTPTAGKQQRAAFPAEMKQLGKVGPDGRSGQGDRRFQTGRNTAAHRDPAGHNVGISLFRRDLTGPVGNRGDHSGKTFLVRLADPEADKEDAEEDPQRRQRRNQIRRPQSARKGIGCNMMHQLAKVAQQNRRQPGHDPDHAAEQENIVFLPESTAHHHGAGPHGGE